MIFVLMMVGVAGFGQISNDSIAKNVCECLKKIPLDKTDSATLIHCYMKCITGNGITLLSNEIVNKLAEKCPQTMMDIAVRINAPKNNIMGEISDSISCRIMRKGKFKEKGRSGNIVTYTAHEVVEDDSINKSHSVSKIKWLNDCEYITVFDKSDNKEINNMIKRGEEIDYRILKIEGKIITLSYKFRGVEIPYKLEKME